MQQSKELSEDEKKVVADESMGSLGEPPSAAVEATEAESKSPIDPIEARLGRQEKRHKKELREMQARMEAMQAQFSQPQHQRQDQSVYSDAEWGADNDQIQKAVAAALRAKDDHERQMQDRQKMQHVHKQYQALQDHLDNAGSNYDDFDEVVRGNDTPFTESMRDTSLLIPNAADVLYKLGKNRQELERVAALHPLDQAKEMIKMSIALMGSGKSGNNQTPRPIGQIKNNPVSSHESISERTPVSELRKRMKAGWK